MVMVPNVKRQSLAIFYGGSWGHPAQFILFFILVPLVFDESDWRVGTYSHAIKILSLDPSQKKFYLRYRSRIHTHDEKYLSRFGDVLKISLFDI